MDTNRHPRGSRLFQLIIPESTIPYKNPFIYITFRKQSKTYKNTALLARHVLFIGPAIKLVFQNEKQIRLAFFVWPLRVGI